MFEYDNLNNLDERAEFANDVCKLILQNNNYDLEKSKKEIKKIYNHFFINVKNIYELIDREIPLFGWYELNIHKWDNWDFESKKEFLECREQVKKICLIFYQ